MKLKFFALLATALMLTTSAWAQEYPTHTVRLLVGFSPGGAPDTVGRILGQKLAQTLKQSFIVNNRPGAGATLATGIAAKAQPDGYTLVVTDVSQIAVAPYIHKELSYDPVKDLTPIAMVAAAPIVIMSNAKTTTIKTLADLVKQAKASPGSINYGSSGIGSIHHLAMEMFKYDAGIDLTHIAYKGAGQSVPALLTGEVQLVASGFTQASAYGKSGQANLIAVTTAKRYSEAPDIPALSEFYKGFDYSSEIGIMGPANMPPEVVNKLSNAIKAALDDPETKEAFRKVGLIPTWLSSQDYAENIRQNLKKYKRAVEIARVPPN